jgi:acetyl-CoA/propionyl-CoA carboxylase biotin carboxyl carrier protein
LRTLHKILIANRAEIALRVIRTATDLGIDTVAVYADQDIDAPFVRAATEAWALGGTTTGQTYASASRILDLALRSGADAVHPGYGFLSEDPGFARAVADAGLVWLGPDAEVIRALGDKISARRIAEAADVPPVPGLSDPLSSRTEVEGFIAAHGFPVVLKRADGGGGRGISVLASPADVDLFFARHADDDVLGACFIERFIEVARHVETQCARDALGSFRVVSTRDCSIQRRNQKLIEEAPAPFLPAGVDGRLDEWSRRLFERVGYVGVGTCEFLLEPDGHVWFLEVNPRLQVEHPVSEEVAGVDLVEEQIRIARGLPLTVPPPPRGHSFEFRITSEDPAHGLIPSAGRATGVSWPSGPGVRLELGLAEGDEVQTAFDSMLAKIVVTGATREQALARSRRALDEFSITGVPTPVSVYRDILDDPAFTGEDAGFSVSTRWLETRFLPAHDYSGDTEAAALPSGAAHADPAAQRRAYTIELDGRRRTLTLPQGLLAAVGAGGHARPAQPLRAARQAPRAAGAAAGPDAALRADGTLVAPMQAIVVHAVPAGTHVEAGDLVVVLEAMKMEKHIQAPYAGTVTEIIADPGASVAPGDPLARITADGPGEKEES